MSFQFIQVIACVKISFPFKIAYSYLLCCSVFPSSQRHSYFSFFHTPFLCIAAGSGYCPWATAKEKASRLQDHTESRGPEHASGHWSSTLSLKLSCMCKALAELGSSSQGTGKGKTSWGQPPMQREQIQQQVSKTTQVEGRPGVRAQLWSQSR